VRSSIRNRGIIGLQRNITREKNDTGEKKIESTEQLNQTLEISETDDLVTLFNHELH